MPSITSTRLVAGAFVIAMALMTGCAPATLPGTKIPDTEQTRAIDAVIGKYQEAMEARDVQGILALVSKRYYENSGTTETDSDDYGYQTLRDKVLPQLRQNIEDVQYRILLRDITVKGDRAWADYEYYYRFKYIEGGKEGWSQKNDFNRLTFAKENGQWKIISGL